MVDFSKRAALMLAMVFMFTAACSDRPAGVTGDAPAPLSVVVTFDALFELAVAIGGERASVANVMPAGAEAHHFEPSARDLTLLSSADVFLICGLGFEPWAENAINAAGNDGLVVGDVSHGIDPILVSDGDRGGADAMGHSPEYAGYDPHIWLSPVCAAIIAENIRDTFISADAAGADYYRRNCDGFVRLLGELFDEYDGKFSMIDNKALVTGHAVFAYLCRDFGLIQNSIEGVFAEGEPSARELAELIDFCRAGGITAVLAESLSSPLVAETLAAEAGAEVFTIFTMESAEDGLSFLARMEHNLAVIYSALC